MVWPLPSRTKNRGVHSISGVRGAGLSRPPPLPPGTPNPPTPESGRWWHAPQRVSSAALFWSPASATPWRSCLNPSCLMVRSQHSSKDGRFHAVAEDAINGHLREGSGRCGGRRGKHIFPFSLHEEDMPPKMEYTRIEGHDCRPVATRASGRPSSLAIHGRRTLRHLTGNHLAGDTAWALPHGPQKPNRDERAPGMRRGSHDSGLAWPQVSSWI